MCIETKAMDLMARQRRRRRSRRSRNSSNSSRNPEVAVATVVSRQGAKARRPSEWAAATPVAEVRDPSETPGDKEAVP